MIFRSLVSASGASGVLLLVAITAVVTVRAWPAYRQFGLSFLWRQQWNPITDSYGALPLVYGTVVSSMLALLIATPLGIGVAIFLSEDQLPPRARISLSHFIIPLPPPGPAAG